MRRYFISILLLLPLLLFLYSSSSSTRAFGLGSTFFISQSSGGEPGNGASESPSIAEGNKIAFASEASNLVANDNNEQRDIFLRTGSTTIRVSEVPGTGADANGASSKPEISDNGEWVVFESYATNLVSQTTDITVTDIFRYNVNTEEIRLVTVTADGEPADGQSQDPYVTNNGQWVVFASSATNLVNPAPTGAKIHIYLRNMEDNTTQVVSRHDDDSLADRNSFTPSITQDGTEVLFVSLSNLIADSTPNSCLSALACQEVFIRHLDNETTEVVSLNSAGVPVTGTGLSGGSQLPVMSANGDWVVFESNMRLVPADGNGIQDIYLRDRVNNITQRISVKVNGSTTDEPSQFADISPNGEWITFASKDPQLVQNDSNGRVEDTFRYHNTTLPEALKIISVATGGQQTQTEASRESSILDSGEQIAFRSFAEDVVPDNDFTGSDIFLHDLSIQVTPTPTVTGTPPTSTPTASNTPTVTGTPPTNTPTNTPIVTETLTNTPTQTPSVTNTPTNTRTPALPATFTPIVTGTPPTNTPTVTGTPPTNTPTVTGTLPTVTGTPPTRTPTVTGTLPTVTGTPPTSTPTVTGTPPTLTPGPGTPSITPTVDPNIYLPIIQR